MLQEIVDARRQGLFSMSVIDVAEWPPARSRSSSCSSNKASIRIPSPLVKIPQVQIELGS